MYHGKSSTLCLLTGLESAVYPGQSVGNFFKLSVFVWATKL